jgi:hypothetical protein
MDAIETREVSPPWGVDAVLLSHDHRFDNVDREGMRRHPTRLARSSD